MHWNTKIVNLTLVVLTVVIFLCSCSSVESEKTELELLQDKTITSIQFESVGETHVESFCTAPTTEVKLELDFLFSLNLHQVENNASDNWHYRITYFSPDGDTVILVGEESILVNDKCYKLADNLDSGYILDMFDSIYSRLMD